MTSVDSVSKPIPLSVFEKYFLLDSSDEFPMLVDGELCLSGDMDRTNFEKSVRTALQKHPLFTRKIEKRRGRYQWKAQGEPFEITWHDRAPDMESPEWAEPMNLRERIGFELHVFSESGRTRIFYRIHHLCCDGVGFFRFICDVFADYASRKGEHIEIVPPIRPEKIFDRGNFPPAKLPKQLTFRVRLLETIKAVVKWMREKPIPLTGTPEPVDKTRKSRFGKKTYVMPVEETNRYRKAADRAECSLNDLLIAAIFVVMRQRMEVPGKNVQRIMIPLNMRWPGSDEIPAANIISYVFLTKPGEECDWSKKLLPEIHREMKIVKEWKIGYMFLYSLRFFDLIPGGLRLMTGGKACRAGTVFTNTGNLEKYFNRFFPLTDDGLVRFGNMTLESMHAYVPCRAKTNLTISVSLQAQKLLVACQYDRTCLSENDVDRFVDRIRMELSERIGEIAEESGGISGSASSGETRVKVVY